MLTGKHPKKTASPRKTWQPTTLSLNNTFDALTLEDEAIIEPQSKQNQPIYTHNSFSTSEEKDAAAEGNGCYTAAVSKNATSSIRKRPTITTNEKHLTNYYPPKLVPGPHSYSDVAQSEYEKTSPVIPDVHKPKVVVFGDSIPKRLSAFHLSNETGTKAKVRSFPGADTRRLQRHMEIELEHDAPDIAVIHVGTNDLDNNVNMKKILENMTKIVWTLKNAGTRYIVISGLIGRWGLKQQIYDLNAELKQFCNTNQLTYIDNKNIYFSKKYMAKDRIHLNYQGVDKLLDNIIDKIIDMFQ